MDSESSEPVGKEHTSSPEFGVEGKITSPELVAGERDVSHESVEEKMTSEESWADEKSARESIVEDRSAPESIAEEKGAPESTVEEKRATGSIVEEKSAPESFLEENSVPESGVEEKSAPEFVLEDKTSTPDFHVKEKKFPPEFSSVKEKKLPVEFAVNEKKISQASIVREKMASPEFVVKDLLRRLNGKSYEQAENRPSEPHGEEIEGGGGEAIAMAGLRDAIQSSNATVDELVEAVRHAESLLLQNGSMGDKGVFALVRAFKEARAVNLLRLDLSDNDISEHGFASLMDVLDASVLTNLKDLNVSHNLIREEGSYMLANVLQVGLLSALQRLNLSHCYIGDNGVKSLAKAMQSEQFVNRSLQSIDLSANVFGEEGVSALLNVFGHGRAPNLNYLNLSLNMFGEKGSYAIASVLNSGHLSGLTHLLLSRCSLTDGAVLFSEAIEAGRVPNLRVLDVSFNCLGEPGSIGLARALGSGRLSKLQHLNLSECGIPPDAVGSITEAIDVGKVAGLLHVDFSNNFATEDSRLNYPSDSFAAQSTSRVDPGSSSLAKLFRRGNVRDLQFLNLSHCGVTDNGIIALAEEMAVGRLPNLRSLVVIDNDIRSERSIRALVRALESGNVPDLRKLELGYNSLGDDVTLALAQALEDTTAQSPLVDSLKERLLSHKGPFEILLYKVMKLLEISVGLNLRSYLGKSHGNIGNRQMERQSSRLIVEEEKESTSNDKLVFTGILVGVWLLALMISYY